MSNKVRKKTKLVFGVGINDANYTVSPVINGGQYKCPFYLVWKSMLHRLYNKNDHKFIRNYNDCRVCEEWLKFSNFKAWMETQDWFGKELDKDLLVKGNKLYSPQTCLFIGKNLNKFLTDSKFTRGELLIGVSRQKHSNKFKAECSGRILGVKGYIGLFDTEVKAHLAWKKRKHKYACKLAELETDPRIIHALQTRYAGDEIYEA
jgi:hypothetical protein